MLPPSRQVLGLCFYVSVMYEPAVTCSSVTRFVTAGTDLVVTVTSAPADVPPPDGVRPRSDSKSAQTRCLHVTIAQCRRGCSLSRVRANG